MSLSSQIKVPAQVKGAVGGGSGGGATSLDGLSDVVITSAASGDFLRNNGSNFVNTPLSAADIPVNNGLAYGLYTMTADDSATTTPTKVTWDTFTGSGITNSSNEATIGETGTYEITGKFIYTGLSTGGSAGYFRLEDWTSGSSVILDTGREGAGSSSSAFPGISWRGELTSGTKLRVYQYVSAGTGSVDGDGSALVTKACFWEIRRIR